MNIKEAKIEIVRTLRAYNRKDETGAYCYPLVRQRPILLMGPPGIGKTAVMEQAAEECGVGLVAYTITHHTRQSAIGLPHIETKIYDGKQVSVTEYTLSEIIASVYECMERTGKKEGILFIDEINCVSETLAPTMLQFLQNKTFGSHKIPAGWMLVAAGNPPAYNKSVREFDIVTLDRVRKIQVEADLDVWMEYAWQRQIHPAICSYLSIRRENFYFLEQKGEEKSFVTARGWEDLSEILKSYQDLGFPVTEELAIQYLQREETARDFAAYYQLYCKYGEDYGILRILQGLASPEEYKRKTDMAAGAAFDERFTVVNLLLGGMDDILRAYSLQDKRVAGLYQAMKHLKTFLDHKEKTEVIEEFICSRKKTLEIKVENGLFTGEEKRLEEWILKKLQEFYLSLKKDHVSQAEEGFQHMKKSFQAEVEERKKAACQVQEELERAFAFLETAFGDGQEMVLFVTGLTQNDRAAEFLSAWECPLYLKWSQKLLYREQEEKLKEVCREVMGDIQ